MPINAVPAVIFNDLTINLSLAYSDIFIRANTDIYEIPYLTSRKLIYDRIKRLSYNAILNLGFKAIIIA